MIKQTHFILICILIMPYQSINAQQKSKTTISLYENPIESTIKLIDSAKFKVQALVYKFEEESLLKALVRAHKRGVKIKILVDGNEAKKKNSLVKSAKEKGVKIRKWKQSKLHVKLLIIDEKTAIAGSFNWTEAAKNKNLELLIIDNNKPSVDNYVLLFEDLWERDKNVKN